MKHHILDHTLTIIGVVTIGCILMARAHLAYIRHIDPDEFAHLHWAYLIVSRYLPYKDFFFYILPLFQWFLSPLFLLPHGPMTIILARYLMLIVFCTSLYLLYNITYRYTKHHHASILSVIICAIFPMTLDKTVDIRPDVLMMCGFLFSLYLLIKEGWWTWKRSFLLGASLSISLLILSKMIVGIPAYGVLFLAIYWKHVRHQISWWRWTYPMIVGAIIPIGIIAMYLWNADLFSQAYNALAIDAFIVNEGKIPFTLWQSLSPWPIVYLGRGGPSVPWGVNTGIWILSLLGMTVLLLRKQVMGWYTAVFFLTGWIFLMWFPAPYTQYFLPFTFFASFLIAYLFVWKKNLFPLLFLLTIVICSISFGQQYYERVQPGGENTEQMDVIRHILSSSDPTDTMFDMVGSYVFRPDAYFLCCHPYPEFSHRLSPIPPPLRQSLKEKQTPFLIMDRTGFLFWKTPYEDQLFMRQHYLPSIYPKMYHAGQQFSCTSGSCIHIDLDGNPVHDSPTHNLSLIAEGIYEISTTPRYEAITIDGSAITHGQYLTSGVHTFSVPPSVTSLKIYYKGR